MEFAALIIVDNHAEDPEAGRRGLRDELLPALRSMPGFIDARLLTDYDRGRGVALVVFEARAQAETLAESVKPGMQIREGVTVVSSEVLEVTVAS